MAEPINKVLLGACGFLLAAAILCGVIAWMAMDFIDMDIDNITKKIDKVTGGD